MTLPLSLEWDKDEHFERGASASDGAISRQAIPVQRTSELAAAASIPFKINFSIQIPFRRPRSQTSLVKLLYSKVISLFDMKASQFQAKSTEKMSVLLSVFPTRVAHWIRPECGEWMDCFADSSLHIDR